MIGFSSGVFYQDKLLKKHREEVSIIDIVNMTVKTTNPVRQLAILPKTQSYFTPIVRYKKKHSFASYKMILSNMCYPFYTQVNFDLYHVHTDFTYKSILLRLAHSTL